MLKSIESMFLNLNKNKIKYCHWKSNEHLLAALEGDTDLDILFSYEQRNIIDIVLNQCGLKRFRTMPLSQYNAIEDFIGFDDVTGKIWHVHLHYRLTIGEPHLKSYTINKWNNLVLDDRRELSVGIYTSSYEDEMILLFVRMALKLQIKDWFLRVSDDDKREYKWLKDRIDIYRLENRAKLFLNKDSFIELKKIIENGIIYRVELKQLQLLLHKELMYFTGLSRFSSFFQGNIRGIYSMYGSFVRKFFPEKSFPYRRISPSGGCVVAFVGSDGAGKSTSIKRVKEELSKKIDVRIVYLGSGDGACSILRLPMKFVARRFAGKGLGKSVKLEQENTRVKLSIKSKLYIIAKFIWALTLAMEKANKLKLLTRYRNEGMIVLLDRYPQLVTPYCCDGVLLFSYLNSRNYLLKKLAEYEYNIYSSFENNLPDIFIKLIVDPEIAIKRKTEMTIEEIEEKRDIVLSMYPNQRSYVIDTNKDEDDTFKIIMKCIWRHV